MYRILIVDDEYLIRESIQKKLERAPIPFSEILQAGTQQEALALVFQKPFDIIVCDIRLGKDNGLDFLSIVREHHKETAFIVLSGHSEFSYARTAISLRVVDYLLKPINTADFYKALEHGIEQSQKYKDTHKNNSQKRKKQLERELQKEFKENLVNNRFTIDTYMSEYRQGEDLLISASLYLIESTSEDFDTLTETLDINPFWAWGENFIIFLKEANQIQFFFVIPMLHQLSRTQQVVQTLSEIETLLFQKGIFRFSIGMSKASETVRVAHAQSMVCIENRILKEENTFIHYTPDLEGTQKYLLSSEKLSYYRLLLKNTNYKALEAFYAELEHDLRTTAKIKYFYLQILYNTLKDEMISSHPNLFQGKSLIMTVYYFDSISAMINYLKKQFLYIVEKSSEGQEKNWMLITLNSIKATLTQNFSENLLLEDFARQYHVNTSFLSNQFSQQFGISYQDYLSQVRIEHAQELLTRNKYTINEISQLCGFSNQHYFSKVFKKKTGQTPSEYKRALNP
ncbi:MAG: response regulator [Faecalibacterium sp.]